MGHTFVGVAMVLNLARSCDRSFDVGVELSVVLDVGPMVDIPGCPPAPVGPCSMINWMPAGSMTTVRGLGRVPTGVAEPSV